MGKDSTMYETFKRYGASQRITSLLFGYDISWEDKDIYMSDKNMLKFRNFGRHSLQDFKVLLRRIQQDGRVPNESKEIDTKVVKIQKYVIEVNHLSDGSTEMRRTNDGFSAIELIGMCGMIKREVFLQMDGHLKPDIVTREVVSD
jgi:hypothetical protein